MKRKLQHEIERIIGRHQMQTDDVGTPEDATITALEDTKESIQMDLSNCCNRIFTIYHKTIGIYSEIQHQEKNRDKFVKDLNDVSEKLDALNASVVSQEEKLKYKKLNISYIILPLFDTVLASLGSYPIFSHYLYNQRPVVSLLATLILSSGFAFMHREILPVTLGDAPMSMSRKVFFWILLGFCILLVPFLYLMSMIVFETDPFYCTAMAIASAVIQGVSSFIYYPYVKSKVSYQENKEVEETISSVTREEEVLENSIEAADTRISDLAHEGVHMIEGTLRESFVELRHLCLLYNEKYHEKPTIMLEATCLFFMQAYFLQSIDPVIGVPAINAPISMDDLLLIPEIYRRAGRQLTIPQSLLGDLQRTLGAPDTQSAIAPPSPPVTEPAPSSAPEPTPTTTPDDSSSNVVGYTDETDDDDFDPFRY